MPDVSEIAVDDALFGEILSPRVQQIIRLEREADDAQWEAARLITEELAAGKSQRQLAREIGKSLSHVHYMAKCWKLSVHYSEHSYASFSEFYNSPLIRTAEGKAESEPAKEADPLPGLEAGPAPESEPEEKQPEPGSPPFAEDEAGTADDLGSSEPDAPPVPSSAGNETGPGSRPEPKPESGPSRPNAAKEKLDRLKQFADEEERANPEEPVAELLDAQRALCALIPKTRAFRAAGLEINAALANRIDSLYQEWRRLL